MEGHSSKWGPPQKRHASLEKIPANIFRGNNFDILKTTTAHSNFSSFTTYPLTTSPLYYLNSPQSSKPHTHNGKNQT